MWLWGIVQRITGFVFRRNRQEIQTEFPAFFVLIFYTNPV